MLANAYLPAVAEAGGRILWVGTRPYTAENYAVLASGGGEVWTTDVDPQAARWGQSGRHRTGDVCEIDRLFSDMIFDTIIFNGVLGFGVDAPEDQQRALTALAKILRPGGLMLLGWNTDRIDDPVAAGLTDELYARTDFAGQPSRVAFPDSTHVYDAFRRTSI
ncbi:class I SAM-dependent methyltransferase [Brevundimonas sp.]|uniref:class I SAM-dependent methyltransferase n=1 Tax=Brevundimonas sp. TaxID=1871086 RepID=UPI0025C48EDC|nr:class I SAM-dependent methyltransferase [Brevundimonas sp.]